MTDEEEEEEEDKRNERMASACFPALIKIGILAMILFGVLYNKHC